MNHHYGLGIVVMTEILVNPSKTSNSLEFEDSEGCQTLDFAVSFLSLREPGDNTQQRGCTGLAPPRRDWGWSTCE